MYFDDVPREELRLSLPVLSALAAASPSPTLIIILRETRTVIISRPGNLVLEDPRRLETEALQRYFKKSKKLSTFERQLYRFGFRKLTRGGKMEVSQPCNDCTMQSLQTPSFRVPAYRVHCTFCMEFCYITLRSDHTECVAFDLPPCFCTPHTYMKDLRR